MTLLVEFKWGVHMAGRCALGLVRFVAFSVGALLAIAVPVGAAVMAWRLIARTWGGP